MTRTVVDLHVHTTVSDGTYSPREIVLKSRELGLTTIGICDHDTIDGVPLAQEASRGTELEVIPGVEISVDASGWEVHILGYYVDHTRPALVEELTRSRKSRLQRARRMLSRLESLGVSLSWERVLQIASDGVVGRPHIAMALEEARFVESTQEAFDRYLGRGRPAYVSRAKMTTARALRLVREADGVPVLAHPWTVTRLVPDLVDQGLAGLEAYYTGYTSSMVSNLVALADEHGLVCTGGSDFHGLTVLPDSHLGGVSVPTSCVTALRLRRRAICAIRG